MHIYKETSFTSTLDFVFVEIALDHRGFQSIEGRRSVLAKAE